MFSSSTPYTEMNGEWFIVPNWLGIELTKLGVKANERLVYMTLLRFANNSENNPFPSYKRIQEHTGIVGRTTLSNCLKNLERVGLIEKTHQGTTQGDSNRYKVNYIYPEGYIESTQKPQEGLKQSKRVNTPKGNKKPQESQSVPYRRGVQSNGLTPEENQELKVEGGKFLNDGYSRAEAVLDSLLT